jgi:hypothetical protein
VIALLITAAATLFGISVLSLALIQARTIARSGWKAVQFNSYQEMRELYWNNLSVHERWLVYPGLVAFVTLAAAAVAQLIYQHFAG